MSDRDAPRRAAHRWVHRTRDWRPRRPRAALLAVVSPVARRLFRVRIEGDQHLPANGPAIIAANHLSFFDHVALVVSVGHTGVGQLSTTTGVPVVPTGIVGTNHIQPPGARLPRPFRPALVRFGPPIDPTSYRGTRRECRRRITSDVMRAIGELSGQRPGTAD